MQGPGRPAHVLEQAVPPPYSTGRDLAGILLKWTRFAGMILSPGLEPRDKSLALGIAYLSLLPYFRE